MTSRPLTEPTLRALLSQLASRDRDRRRVVAVAAEPRWTGDGVITTEVGPTRIVPCVSPLAVRSALVDHAEKDSETLVVLTDLAESQLGEEVLGRVWEGRLHEPTSWLALQQLAKVDRLDPSLAEHRWLVELLVRVAPGRGYPAPPGGALTMDAAWRLALRHACGLTVDQPTLDDLLTWAQTDEARHAVGQLQADEREQIAGHLVATVSPAARHLLGLVVDGQGADVVPVGLVADVIWRDEADPQLAYARGQLDARLHHGMLSGAAARAWGRAAVKTTRSVAAGDEPEAAVAWTSRAEQLLTELDAAGVAGASEVLPSGFERRLEQAGYALAAVLDEPTTALLDPLEQYLTAVAEHLAADSYPDRVEGLRAAVRLARRLVATPTVEGTDLTALARDYERDGAWVDAARDQLRGETVASLAEAYATLQARVDGDRVERDRAFSSALAAWSSLAHDGSVPLLPIEAMLDRLVAPIAKHVPALLLIVDGLSHAASHGMLADIARRGWRRHVPGDASLPTVIAAIPTVTRISRASQLTGSLTSGDATVERDGFASHPGLRAASANATPVLFHKADLGDVDGRVAPKVQQALLDPDQQVVGIVVNGADDHLAKGTQLRLADGIRALRPLGPILDAASEAGRAVILTADHGHVVEHDTTYRAGDGGERWRTSDSGEVDPEHEVELAGPRVLRGEGRIIAAATDRIRYITGDKRGYHGGATPAEVLCPLAVLLPSATSLAGWEPAPLERPLWWDQGISPDLGTTPTHPADDADAIFDAAPVDAKGTPVLFPETPDPGAAAQQPSPVASDLPSWIGQLLASPTLAQQRAMSGRVSLDDDELAGLLGLLVAAGGTAPISVIGHHLQTTPMRTRGKLDALRRLLNVDGYEIVDVRLDTGTVELNRELLATQFALDLT